MLLKLNSLDLPQVDAWRSECTQEGVEIIHDSILDVKADAWVSPANSYGFMDGGLDGLYLDHFGRDIQLRVRRMIYERHYGELLVGAADLVETGTESPSYLVVAPTMRVPMILKDSVAPYLAMRAIILLWKHGTLADGTPIRERVHSVAVPGLGTGTGRVGVRTAARQMGAAIRDFLSEEWTMPQSWAEASERHQLLYTSRPRAIHREH